jgi:hypothetical protein
MCKTWNIAYECGHKFDFRLSKCRATVYTQSRPGRPYKPACMGGAALVFKKTYPCGDCAIKQREQELSGFRAKLEDGSKERQDAEAEFMKEMFVADRSFPLIARFKKPKPLERCGLTPKQMRGSLLKQEVLIEEIEAKKEVDDDWNTYYEEWNGGWTTPCDTVDEPFDWDSISYDPVEQDDSNSLPAGYCMPYYDYWSYVSNRVRQAEREREEQLQRGPTEAHVEERDIKADIQDGAEGRVGHVFVDSEKSGKRTTDFQDTSSMCTDNTNLRHAPSTTTTTTQYEQVETSAKHSFNTIPPHLRKQKAAIHQNYSDANAEPFDIFEKRYCFQFQSVMIATN